MLRFSFKFFHALDNFQVVWKFIVYLRAFMDDVRFRWSGVSNIDEVLLACVVWMDITGCLDYWTVTAIVILE